MFIREAGDIPFAKNNVPQLSSFECSDPVWEVSANPYSAVHTPGGSSGDEAATLAMDGAALGWGSDIGGSLRIPAHCCGICLLKPGHGRNSNLKQYIYVRIVKFKCQAFTELERPTLSYRSWVQEWSSSLRTHG